MIIAVDFDGTLRSAKGEPNLPLIRHLQRMQEQGHSVVLWTCREGKSLLDAVSFLRAYRFIPNRVNCNPPSIVKKQGYDSRKIYADVYIDDKCVNAAFCGGGAE